MIADGLSIPCHVTTNGSQYNPRVERILKALPVSLSISIDGATKETVEKVRVNADYQQLMDNLNRFLSYARSRRTYLSLTYCLMRQNWHEFGQFLRFADRLECPVFVNTVIDPSHCSLYTLPPAELQAIVESMEKQGPEVRNHVILNRHLWESALAGLRENANERQVQGVRKIKEAAFEARRDGPEGTRSHVTAAWKLCDAGRYAEALEEVLKTPNGHPHYYHSVVLSGHIRRVTADLEVAEQELDRAVKMSPRRPEGFATRAWLRLDQNRIEEGIADALRARELAKGEDELETDISDVLALLYQRSGKPSR
jgi:hypothetical protein